MRILDVGSGHGDDLFGVVNTRSDQFTQNRHALKIHRPNDLTFINRSDFGNLRADVACWMRTLYIMSCQLFSCQVVQLLREILVRTKANMNLPLGEFCKRLKSFLEPFFLALHDEIIIGCQRRTVEGTDEDGLGLVVGVGHRAERALAQHGPKAALQHGRLDFLCGLHR